MKTPVFIALDQALQAQADQIRHYGGSHGVREMGLLESALAMPQQRFGGEYLHGSLAEMAAAYLFHVAQNHPFVDGNKRTALMLALAFVRLNGDAVQAQEDELTNLVLRVAEGGATKSDVAVFLAARMR